MYRQLVSLVMSGFFIFSSVGNSYAISHKQNDIAENQQASKSRAARHAQASIPVEQAQGQQDNGLSAMGWTIARHAICVVPMAVLLYFGCKDEDGWVNKMIEYYSDSKEICDAPTETLKDVIASLPDGMLYCWRGFLVLVGLEAGNTVYDTYNYFSKNHSSTEEQEKHQPVKRKA